MSGQNNQSYLHRVLQGLQSTHAAWQGNSPNATSHSPVSEANSEEAAELLREAANHRVGTLSAAAEPYYDPRLRTTAPLFSDPRLRANAPVFVRSANVNAAAEAAAAGRNLNANTNNFNNLSRNITAAREQGGRRRRARKSRKRSQKKRVRKSRRYHK
jgi:hypothetical protein